MADEPETNAMTAAEFLAAAVRSRLLTEAQTKGLNGTAAEIAKKLVADGKLTSFQSKKLLQGLWQGLMIGRFRILEPVGRGGMGVVYRAADTGAYGERAEVALKILPPKKASEEPRTKARFLHEVKIGRELPKDKHIARVYDTGITDGVAFVAMEFVVGRTLKSVVTDDGPLTIPIAAGIFIDVARGLAASHTAGVIHRDVKPSNVMITPSGAAKLLDFGFALRPGDPLATDPAVVGGAGYTLGTFDFIPPEQVVNAAAVTPVSDQYSLGCSMYYALTGQPPFPGGTAKEKLRKHKHEDAVPLSLVRPDLPVEFTGIVERLMAKQPSQRYESCTEVAAVLEQWTQAAEPTQFDFKAPKQVSDEDDLGDFAAYSPPHVGFVQYWMNAFGISSMGWVYLAVAALVIVIVMLLR